MPIIPIDIDQVPDRAEVLDEGETYKVVVREFRMAGVDKNGDDYMTLGAEVLEPLKYAGVAVSAPYIGLPKPVTPDMSFKEKRQSEQRAIDLKRIVMCFRIKYDSQGVSSESAVGQIGTVTIRNEEYPAGSGRVQSKINDYLQ